MKNLIKQFIFIIFISFSLSSLAQQNQKMQLIDLQYKFPENMDDELKQKLDSSFQIMEQQFNQESMHFKLAQGKEQVAHIFVLDLSKVKVVSTRRRKTFDWINGIGMTVVPITAFAMGATAPLMLNYIPSNVMKSSLSTSEGFSGQAKNIKMNLCTGVLFTNDVKMRNKLARKFTTKLYKQLKKLDSNQQSNASAFAYSESKSYAAPIASNN